MSEKFGWLIRNASGLFVRRLVLEPVLPEEHLLSIEKALQERIGELSAQEIKVGADFIAAIKRLPVEVSPWFLDAFDVKTNLAPEMVVTRAHRCGKAARDVKLVPCRVAVTPAGFENKPHRGFGEDKNPEILGSEWAAVGQIKKAALKISALLVKLGFPALRPEGIAKAASLQKMTFEKNTAEGRAKKNQAFAIWDTKESGFWATDKKIGSLASAALFESDSAAARSAKLRKMKDAAVVEVKMEIASFRTLSEGSDASALAAVKAQMEEKALTEMLEKADIERLRARLDAQEKANQSKAPAAAKKRL